MIDREKVIKGLRICFAITHCDGCPYEVESRKITRVTPEDHCPILEDVLALLEEQEPRVLTADELYLMEHKCVYLERRNSKLYSTEPSIVRGTSKALFCQYKYILMRENKISDVRYSSDYNKETKSGWRCWSAKPTEERRKEVKWE